MNSKLSEVFFKWFCQGFIVVKGHNWMVMKSQILLAFSTYHMNSEEREWRVYQGQLYSGESFYMSVLIMCKKLSVSFHFFVTKELCTFCNILCGYNRYYFLWYILFAIFCVGIIGSNFLQYVHQKWFVSLFFCSFSKISTKVPSEIFHLPKNLLEGSFCTNEIFSLSICIMVIQNTSMPSLFFIS